ncbi:MAG TPA: hypothetical protein VEL31_29625 [Ktedonobacteraceae bacterium]|nr:hypothetical protein [Ktedonobacteraceae bacterium]
MPRGKKNIDEQIAALYYTAQEAQEKLGMKRDKFNHYVRRGVIHNIPFLSGYGYYKKTEIDALAQEIEEFLDIGHRLFTYRRATLQDLDAEIALAALNYGKKKAEVTRKARMLYLQANPEITHYLLRDNQIVAAFTMAPLTHDAIMAYREEQINGLGAQAYQIHLFEPGERLECVIINIMTTTKVTLDQRHRYAATLLRNFTKITLREWAMRGVDIATVDARAGSDEGEKLLRQAGFRISSSDNHEHKAYHLDIDASDAYFLREYKELLAEWKRQHEK